MVLRFVVDVHTTCFGLHGHLQVCIFHFLFLKESASLLLLPLLHVVILCSIAGIKSEISHTPEDGHVGRNM
jgi:hypothetical protein